MLQRFQDKTKTLVKTPHMEQVTAVILFLDVSGFTKLSESLASAGPARGSEGLAYHLNSYFSQLVRIVSGSGGGDSDISAIHAPPNNSNKQTSSNLLVMR